MLLGTIILPVGGLSQIVRADALLPFNSIIFTVRSITKLNFLSLISTVPQKKSHD
jgi:hypothetical protein